jgi:hypothetical protein
VRLLAPRLLDVEARQANHGAHREHEAEDPIPPRLIEDGEVDDHRGREAERDRVDQGVELLAEATPAVGRAAMRPSSASATPPKTMYDTAREKSPRDAATIAKTPKNRFASVNPFGRRTTARRGCGRRTVTGLPVGR